MSWSKRALAEFASGDNLQQPVQDLLQEQRRDWPLFSQGEQALQHLQRRRIDSGDEFVVLQANPRRKVSSGAKLDAKSIAARPCFLCEANLPSEERGLLFDQNWFVVANPFPIVPGHLSIPNVSHLPQSLRENIDAMLNLAAALPEYAIFYNGPRCGASAPDHLHFQACLRSYVPSLDALDVSRLLALLAGDSAGVQQQVLSWPSRRALLLVSRRQQDLLEAGNKSLDQLRDLMGEDQEPLVNVFAMQIEQAYALVIFPRGQHRPDCFFAEGDAQILVSPGALDMAGLMVVADLDHYARIDDKMVCDIYAQVGLDAALFARWSEALL